jgi:hypothetical protein
MCSTVDILALSKISSKLVCGCYYLTFFGFIYASLSNVLNRILDRSLSK